MIGQREMGADDYLDILRRRWSLVLIMTVIGCAAAAGVLHVVPKKYTSQTLVLVQQATVPGDYVKPVVSDATNERLASMQEEILSRSRLEPVIQKLGLYSQDRSTVPMEDLVG